MDNLCHLSGCSDSDDACADSHVVDYFATVSTGERLILPSLSKVGVGAGESGAGSVGDVSRYQQQRDLETSTLNRDCDGSLDGDDDDEEAFRALRFYREIISLRLVSSDSIGSASSEGFTWVDHSLPAVSIGGGDDGSKGGRSCVKVPAAVSSGVRRALTVRGRRLPVPPGKCWNMSVAAVRGEDGTATSTIYGSFPCVDLCRLENTVRKASIQSKDTEHTMSSSSLSSPKDSLGMGIGTAAAAVRDHVGTTAAARGAVRRLGSVASAAAATAKSPIVKRRIGSGHQIWNERGTAENTAPAVDCRQWVHVPGQHSVRRGLGRPAASSPQLSHQGYRLAYRRRCPDEIKIAAVADVMLLFLDWNDVTNLSRPRQRQQRRFRSSSSSSPTQEFHRAATSLVGGALRLGAESIVACRKITSSPTATRKAVENNRDEKVQSPSPPNSSLQSVPLDSLLALPKGYDELILPDGLENCFVPILASDDGSPPDRLVLHDFVPGQTTIPILVVRRQRVGIEERFHEDPAATDIGITFFDARGRMCVPLSNILDDDDDDDDNDDDDALSPRAGFSLLSDRDKTPWTEPAPLSSSSGGGDALGRPVLLLRHNRPRGLADVPFAVAVSDRFPSAHYPNFPCPVEELPMFCYPAGGCRLTRMKYGDVELPEGYEFVIRSESGENIYVSCLSFMEPLSTAKIKQLNTMSRQRRHTSLPHRKFCEMEDSHCSNDDDTTTDMFGGRSLSSNTGGNGLLTAFEDMTTFENKTLCVVSRYPFWDAYRNFLMNLYSASMSSSDLPIERIISHFCLSVPVPTPGGPRVIIPLEAISTTIVLEMPPTKDLPLCNLRYHSLLSCLDARSVVLVVLGLLSLERKVVLVSTRPDRVTSCCELMRSLLFPFELCAPYVPRLTRPFMSCLEFPGAFFCGIHDDGRPGGPAAAVREEVPDESILVDLDRGTIEAAGDDNDGSILRRSWEGIPSYQREALVEEIEMLAADAGLTPGSIRGGWGGWGHEAMSTASTRPPPCVTLFHHPDDADPPDLDDRALRDAFLRFFASVMAGYERYLVVPDVEWMLSGNDWFDAKGFLARAPESDAPFLAALTATQLFSSFVQRRTESCDVRCMLFDECLAEYHVNAGALGRLAARRVRTEKDDSILTGGGGGGGCGQRGSRSAEVTEEVEEYSLLIDVCVHLSNSIIMEEQSSQLDLSVHNIADVSIDCGSGNISNMNTSISGARNFNDISRIDQSILTADSFPDGRKGNDVVTAPNKDGLGSSSRFVYYVDGSPSFPNKFGRALFSPQEPKKLSSIQTQAYVPILTRSDQELEEANRRRKIATSYGRLQSQRRCIWQLPKLMGSHVLGAWLMCIPSQVSQTHLSLYQQQRFFYRAFGALRNLRQRHRIVPDEACYRALIVACGRTRLDCRNELVRLFGLLRGDGIFPNAVTLGQYTKAIAEGFSSRCADDGGVGGGSSIESFVREECSNVNDSCVEGVADQEHILMSLDSNIDDLESSGREWKRLCRLAGMRGDLGGASTADRAGGGGAFNDSIMSNHHSVKNKNVSSTNLSSNASNSTPAVKKSNSSWSPLLCSTSLRPHGNDYFQHEKSPKPSPPLKLVEGNFELVALWSRAASCETCDYIPLDEEIQAGWDIVGGTHSEMPGSIICPRCGNLTMPMLGYRHFSLRDAELLQSKHKQQQHQQHHPTETLSSSKSIVSNAEESLDTTSTPHDLKSVDTNMAYNHVAHFNQTLLDRSSYNTANENKLPCQLGPLNAFRQGRTEGPKQDSPSNNNSNQISHQQFSDDEEQGYVMYMSPAAVRVQLESYVAKHGESVLDRDTLHQLDKRLFYNFWWFCARFSLPLPLPVEHSSCPDMTEKKTVQSSSAKKHLLAFAAWDRTVAEMGCWSGAKVISREIFQVFIPRNIESKKMALRRGLHPLLSLFDVQTFSQTDWDGSLHEVLVKLVEACDKRKFEPVIEAILQSRTITASATNVLVDERSRSVTATTSSSSVASNQILDIINDSAALALHGPIDIDCYRTMLYLTRYHCTSAFHVFFPAITRPCKGYHYWCAMGVPQTIFDRMYAQASASLTSKNGLQLHKGVSDVAIAFRCVFGHII